jgi:hypothetical protein
MFKNMQILKVFLFSKIIGHIKSINDLSKSLGPSNAHGISKFTTYTKPKLVVNKLFIRTMYNGTISLSHVQIRLNVFLNTTRTDGLID